jgi:hypothetical protein
VDEISGDIAKMPSAAATKKLQSNTSWNFSRFYQKSRMDIANRKPLLNDNRVSVA